MAKNNLYNLEENTVGGGALTVPEKMTYYKVTVITTLCYVTKIDTKL